MRAAVRRVGGGGRLTAAARAVAPGLRGGAHGLPAAAAQAVRGRRVAFFTTAPAAAVPRLVAALADDHGAEVVLVSATWPTGPAPAAVARAAPRRTCS